MRSQIDAFLPSGRNRFYVSDFSRIYSEVFLGARSVITYRERELNLNTHPRLGTDPHNENLQKYKESLILSLAHPTRTQHANETLSSAQRSAGKLRRCHSAQIGGETDGTRA